MAFRGRILAVAALVLLGLGVLSPAGAYEVRFDDGACEACWLAPASSRIHLFCLDGQRVFLNRGRKHPNRLKLARTRIRGRLLEDGEATVSIPRARGRDRYEFKDGRLVAFVRKGGDPAEIAAVKNQLGAEVPAETRRAWMWRRVDYGRDAHKFWKGSGRLRLWFHNPNEAGALLALLALLTFGGVLRFGGIWRFHMTTLTAMLFLALLATGSRGSLLAFATGLLVMVVCACGRRMSVRRLAGLGAILLVVALAVGLAFGGTRAVRGLGSLKGQSGRTRLEVWSAVPRMMVCAPTGWWRMPGRCYGAWFQDVNWDKEIEYLLNTHFTVMVFGGFPVALPYVLLWLFLLFSTMREAWTEGRTVAAGQLSALAVAMTFNPVGLSGRELLAVPALTLVPHLWRVVRRRSLRLSHVAWCFALAVLAVLMLAGAGLALEFRERIPFLATPSGGGVLAGRGPVLGAIVSDEAVLSGGNRGALGKEIRQHLQNASTKGAILVTESFDDLPDRVGCLAVAGLRCREYLDRAAAGRRCPQADRVTFVSPPFPPDAIPSRLRRERNISVITGEIAAEAMDDFDESQPWVTVVPGAALYVPDWLHLSGF